MTKQQEFRKQTEEAKFEAFSLMCKKVAELENENKVLTQNLEDSEIIITSLKVQIEKMKCCENCGWYYLQQHWRESKEINESRMFHCGTCGNKKNWKLKEIKEK